MTNIEEICKRKLVVELYCLHHVWVRVTWASNYVY